MGSKDSINVNRPIPKTTVKPAAQKTAKKTTVQAKVPNKETKTFWEKAKDYLREARDTNSRKWANETIAQSQLFRKK